MCGIAGILSFKEPVTSEALKTMTDAIAHRGPVGEGHWKNTAGEIGFGHRRLAIIDLSEKGKQPMHYGNGRYTITFNGEIYNYIEIKKELETKGYQFTSQSDTEVLLALYDNKGVSCLNDLDGMFAFALWDEKEKTLFCARDRFGEKPFYYHHDPAKGFYFASEMKALWAYGIPKRTDESMLALFLENGSQVDKKDLSKTFYKDIKQLDCSHYLLIKTGQQPTIKKYYSLDNIEINESITEEQASQKFYELLLKSVELRLRSDVTVGSSLSGGMDSSSIVMLINILKGDLQGQTTFSARFKDFAKDEGKHINEVIQNCKGVIAHEVWPSGEDMLNSFEKLIYHQEEPFASASIFAQWSVMQLAKQKDIIVLLDGQGADEYLGGYLSYYRSYLWQLFYHDRKTYELELRSYNKLRDANVKHVKETETFTMKAGRYKRKLLGKEMPYGPHYLRDHLKADMLRSGLKELLRYADRNSMAHSREVRLPFLSHHLVEFSFSLPDSFKLHEGWTKWILRKSMENILPKSIAWRIDKIGYEIPQTNWLANPDWQKQIAKGKEIASSFTGNKRSDDWTYLMLAKYCGT
jgi:asparagine synthase (glutamine-hydrolysing)